MRIKNEGLKPCFSNRIKNKFNDGRVYVSFFKIRFNCGIQYRTAALAGIITQFTWGLMQILLYRAFYISSPEAFPMGLAQLSSYFWLQQAFMNLFMTWFLDADIIESITSGGIAYELCRPLDLYNMWYIKSLSSRFSKTAIRCVPILVVASILPKPYNLSMITSLNLTVTFLISMSLGFGVVVAFSMLIYVITFFTLSPIGIRIVALSLMEFLSGGIIPIPFLPESIQKIVELLPFASMQNTPFRIYSGNIKGMEILFSILLQVFWLTLLIILGKYLMKRAVNNAVVQGG
ncbi:ABC transporter permease [Clostridium tagluense]|uniref:ABC transporter permease n=1 Tax=Clostridium tagluense TaxID=360422 RepID=UPI002161C2B8|nr:ABC transporter permease [Clostridium tagluense]